jgi:hypothetical protein
MVRDVLLTMDFSQFWKLGYVNFLNDGLNFILITNSVFISFKKFIWYNNINLVIKFIRAVFFYQLDAWIFLSLFFFFPFKLKFFLVPFTVIPMLYFLLQYHNYIHNYNIIIFMFIF